MRAAAALRRASAPSPAVNGVPHLLRLVRSISRNPSGLDTSLRAIASLGYAVAHNEINVLSPWCTELTLLRVVDC